MCSAMNCALRVNSCVRRGRRRCITRVAQCTATKTLAITIYLKPTRARLTRVQLYVGRTSLATSRRQPRFCALPFEPARPPRAHPWPIVAAPGRHRQRQSAAFAERQRSRQRAAVSERQRSRQRAAVAERQRSGRGSSRRARPPRPLFGYRFW